MVFRLVTLVLVSVAVAGMSKQTPDRALDLERMDLVGVRATRAEWAGRPALRLIEPDSTRQGGLARLRGLTIDDGEIEVSVAGRRGPFAVPDDRGFIGLAFRVRDDNKAYEYIYLRPDNGRAADQVRRNHTTQYASEPDFDFARLRKEAPERYESYVDVEAGAWTRMRIEVRGTAARLFVGDAPQPVLVVQDLKLGTDGGGIGLWIGPGTEGFFSGFSLNPSR